MGVEGIFSMLAIQTRTAMFASFKAARGSASDTTHCTYEGAGTPDA